MTVNLRGMNFLVFPYNAVLNAGVFDDAVVADGDIGADCAVLDDYVLADVARGYQHRTRGSKYAGIISLCLIGYVVRVQAERGEYLRAAVNIENAEIRKIFRVRL